jgi:hypothetical protein
VAQPHEPQYEYDEKQEVDVSYNRYMEYVEHLANLSPMEDLDSLRALVSDADVAMREAALSHRIEQVAMTSSPGEFAQWANLRKEIFSTSDFLSQRLNDWEVIERAQHGLTVDSEEYLAGNDWLQRKIVGATAQISILEGLASSGRTKRVRAEARRRLGKDSSLTSEPPE